MQEPDRNSRSYRAANLAAAGLAGQIGCVVPAIILVSVLLGLWLDRTFGTGRVITLVMVLGSLPLSIYLTFRLAMRAVSEMNRALPTPPARPSPSEEDQTRE